jgi:hypothetical protein
MMNERIKELAIKSGFKKYKNDDGLYSPYIEGYDILVVKMLIGKI